MRLWRPRRSRRLGARQVVGGLDAELFAELGDQGVGVEGEEVLVVGEVVEAFVQALQALVEGLVVVVIVVVGPGGVHAPAHRTGDAGLALRDPLGVVATSRAATPASAATRS